MPRLIFDRELPLPASHLSLESSFVGTTSSSKVHQHDEGTLKAADRWQQLSLVIRYFGQMFVWYRKPGVGDRSGRVHQDQHSVAVCPECFASECVESMIAARVDSVVLVGDTPDKITMIVLWEFSLIPMGLLRCSLCREDLCLSKMLTGLGKTYEHSFLSVYPLLSGDIIAYYTEDES